MVSVKIIRLNLSFITLLKDHKIIMNFATIF